MLSVVVVRVFPEGTSSPVDETAPTPYKYPLPRICVTLDVFLALVLAILTPGN
jgi:hypothetical protein